MYPSNSIRLPLAQLPTPLQLLKRTSEHLGGPRIWIKRDDLTGCLLTGNKVRKLEYLIGDAQAQGARILITSGGLQSNHCRATAVAAAQAGLQAHLILRGETPEVPEANVLLDELAGASLSIYPADVYQAGLAGLFEHWQQEFIGRGIKPYAIPTGGSNAVGVWGYLEAAREMHEQFADQHIDPEYVVCATGSGGTQAGLSLGFSLLRPALSVLGMAVCDDADYFDQKVAADIRGWSTSFGYPVDPASVKVQTNDRYLGPGYAEADSPVFDTIAWLARTEGVVLDPVYTGKAFHGLVNEIRAGRLSGVKDVVFIHTGGVFGIFPYRRELADSVRKGGTL